MGYNPVLSHRSLQVWLCAYSWYPAKRFDITSKRVLIKLEVIGRVEGLHVLKQVCVRPHVPALLSSSWTLHVSTASNTLRS